MRTVDFTPLFRSTVGFDRMQRMLDSMARVDEQAFSYPPYNIEVHGEDAYRITMAVAGFGEDDLDVTVKENRLLVSGKSRAEEEGTSFLHRGIAGRSFERWFELADHIKVKSASLDNGLLRIDLVREVPEEQKPRKISIGVSADGPKAIEGKKAA